ncbi:amidase [Alcaligenaceae bacterium CGII-47]|nr:amidase [Alcaligenaceae bacterium CGII-47]
MLTISNLIAAYAARETSPVEVVGDLLNKISASTINAYITVMADEAMQAARSAEDDIASGKAVGPLHGVPIAVKDLIDVAGCRTTMGSQQYENFIPAEDAVAVNLLRRAGAIIIGKANTHQFAYGSTGDRSYFGAVHNPHDELRISGGSSSGSAAAVAAGLAYASIGSDTSASIRLPAAFCGVVGLKPTLGLVSKKGAFPLSDTLDHVGPLSSCVRDNALLLGIMADRGPQAYLGELGASIQGKTIGIPDTFYCDYVSTDVRNALQRAIEVLQAEGALIKSVSIAAIQEIYAAQQLIIKVEAYALHEAALNAEAPFDSEVRDRLLNGKDVLAADYMRAMQMRAHARRNFDQVLTVADVLLTPTCGITAPMLYERQTSLDGQEYSTPWLLTRLTAPTNLSGHPSLSVPFGSDANTLPIGLQLIGRYDEEAFLYRIGEVLEMGMK